MQAFQRAFIELAIEYDALTFGEFRLKSGRVSPYFFNAGRFCTAAALSRLGSCYAAALQASKLSYDLLFGPAYKGIPLVASTAVALVREHGCDMPFAFNRKEAKDHGEGGSIVGAPLEGRVLILDDVITAGTAMREAVSLVRGGGADVAGILIGLDRGERGTGALSAVQELQRSLEVPVSAIVSIDQLIEYLATCDNLRTFLPQMEVYRRHWQAVPVN